MASKISFYRMLGDTIEERTGVRFDGKVLTRSTYEGLNFTPKGVDFAKFETIATDTVGEFGTYTFCSSHFIKCHELYQVNFDIAVPDWWANDDYRTIADEAQAHGWVIPQEILPNLPEGNYHVSPIAKPVGYRSRKRREDWRF